MLNKRSQNLDTKQKRSRYQKGDLGHLDRTKRRSRQQKTLLSDNIIVDTLLFCFLLDRASTRLTRIRGFGGQVVSVPLPASKTRRQAEHLQKWPFFLCCAKVRLHDTMVIVFSGSLPFLGALWKSLVHNAPMCSKPRPKSSQCGTRLAL